MHAVLQLFKPFGFCKAFMVSGYPGACVSFCLISPEPGSVPVHRLSQAVGYSYLLHHFGITCENARKVHHFAEVSDLRILQQSGDFNRG